MVAGDLEIFELNRQLNLDLPEADDHHTLAGFSCWNVSSTFHPQVKRCISTDFSSKSQP